MVWLFDHERYLAMPPYGVLPPPPPPVVPWPPPPPMGLGRPPWPPFASFRGFKSRTLMSFLVFFVFSGILLFLSFALLGCLLFCCISPTEQLTHARSFYESPVAACDLRASLNGSCFASRAVYAACDSAFRIFPWLQVTLTNFDLLSLFFLCHFVFPFCYFGLLVDVSVVSVAPNNN
jgi:hypothetical protein